MSRADDLDALRDKAREFLTTTHKYDTITCDEAKASRSFSGMPFCYGKG